MIVDTRTANESHDARLTSVPALMPLSENVRHRFWAKVEKQVNGCWLWRGARVRNGYGMVSIAGKKHGAHRIALLLSTGEMPSGREVLHACDVRACVNPAHLSWGTHAQNMRDASNKGRMAGRTVSHCPQGHAYQEGERCCRPCKRAADAERMRRRRKQFYSEGKNSRGKSVPPSPRTSGCGP